MVLVPLATVCAGFVISAGLMSWTFAYLLAVTADVGTLTSRFAEILVNAGKRARMAKESLEIVAQHDIVEVLAAFKELYELARLLRQSGEGLTGNLHPAGTGADQIAAFDAGAVGGIHEVLGAPYGLRR